MSWKAIESAPLDGTEVLICREGQPATRAAWISGRWICSTDYPGDWCYGGTPTHWMPIW
jgi:hypothetical protein